MGDPSKEDHKNAKKRAKAAYKQAKKEAKLDPPGRQAPQITAEPNREPLPSSSRSSHAEGTHESLSPAERSARAAEKQTILRQRQVWISLLGVAVALLTLMLTVGRQGCLNSETVPDKIVPSDAPNEPHSE